MGDVALPTNEVTPVAGKKGPLPGNSRAARPEKHPAALLNIMGQHPPRQTRV